MTAKGVKMKAAILLAFGLLALALGDAFQRESFFAAAIILMGMASAEQLS